MNFAAFGDRKKMQQMQQKDWIEQQANEKQLLKEMDEKKEK
jgi:hypothetical protein